MNHSLLSIIIVNYNGESYLESCIQSIYNTCIGFEYEIIIIDNNSIDNSIKIIAEKFKNVVLIKNNANLGFAAGNNIGVNKSKGDFILLLNNDTILLDNIYPALELIKSKQEIGIVGIKMLDGDNKFVASFGKFPNFYNFFKLKSIQIELDAIEQNIQISNENYIQVDWISGSFLLTTKNIWNRVKGLDESYFMYVEDVDFNKKVHALNKKIVFIPSLSFIHFVGFNKNREKLLINSYKIYIRKHKKGIDFGLSLLLLNLNLLYKKALKRI